MVYTYTVRQAIFSLCLLPPTGIKKKVGLISQVVVHPPCILRSGGRGFRREGDFGSTVIEGAAGWMGRWADFVSSVDDEAGEGGCDMTTTLTKTKTATLSDI